MNEESAASSQQATVEDAEAQQPRTVVKRYRRAAADTSRSDQQSTGPHLWVPTPKAPAGTPTHRRTLAPHRLDGYQGVSAVRPSVRVPSSEGLPPPVLHRPVGTQERVLHETDGLPRPIYRGAAQYVRPPQRLQLQTPHPKPSTLNRLNPKPYLNF